MNIYELEKQATPGPLASQDFGSKHVGPRSELWLARYQDGKQHNYFKLGINLQHLPSKFHEPATVEELATVRLLAHCRNNFMRALELLKIAAGGLKDAGRIGQGQWLDYRIAELEEVKE